MEITVGDFSLEWERKDGKIHKADYDDLIKVYEGKKEHDKEIRDKAIEEFSKRLNEKCNSMIAEKWNSEAIPTSWANAYADFKDDIDEIAEQMIQGKDGFNE